MSDLCKSCDLPLEEAESYGTCPNCDAEVCEECQVVCIKCETKGCKTCFNELDDGWYCFDCSEEA